MKKIIVIILVNIFVWLVLVGAWLSLNKTKEGFVSPVVREKPLLKYTYANLKDRAYAPSKIEFTKIIKSTADDTIWQFFYLSDGKRVSGAANLPAGVGTPSALLKPVVVMIRGYADTEGYYSGYGTERVAAELAKAGYVTLAPDFLGYGDSDPPANDEFEARFQTYTTVLNLIASVEENCKLKIVNCKLSLWGHSNGGQIAISVLEISGGNYPTVLWNPVSKPFPYSILYYTDEFDDKGKALRHALAIFEEDYDVENYSLPNFYSWIKAPVFLQQGEADESVPRSWSDQLYADLKVATVSATYKTYPGADHNMLPKWQEAVTDLERWLSSEEPGR